MDKITNRRMVTIGLLAALFIGALDGTVVVTAGPTLIEELKGLSLFSWVFSIYTMATCVATPIFGKLCDMYGRRRIFIIGVVVFTIGSVLCGSAGSMTQLIWFRLIQGIGNGALVPVVFTIVGDLYAGPQRAKIQGVFASVWSIAALLGPLVGGYFVDYASWRWIFYMNVPVCVFSIVIIIAYLHERHERRFAKIDYLGATVFLIGLSALLFALLSGSDYGWSSPLIIGLFIVAVVLLTFFIFVELRVAEPMIPLKLYKNRVIAALNVSVLFAFSIVAMVSVYLPMWIQSVLGHTATESGLTLMPMSLAWQAGSISVGWLLYRIGAKTSVVFGGVTLTLAVSWLSLLQIDSPYWILIGIVCLMGFGMGYISTPTTVLVQSAVVQEYRGAATASVTLMQSLGQTIGVAVFGSILNAYTLGSENADIAQVAAGIQAIFTVGVGLAVATLISVCLMPTHRTIMEQQGKVGL